MCRIIVLRYSIDETNLHWNCIKIAISTSISSLLVTIDFSSQKRKNTSLNYVFPRDLRRAYLNKIREFIFQYASRFIWIAFWKRVGRTPESMDTRKLGHLGLENDEWMRREVDSAVWCNNVRAARLWRVSIPIRSPSRESNATQDEQKDEKRPKAEWGEREPVPRQAPWPLMFASIPLCCELSSS